MGKLTAAFGWGLGVSVLSVTPAAAIQNIKYETTRFHPYLAAEQYYDDNIYLVPKDQGQTGSWVNRVSPGLAMRTPLHPRYAVALDLRAEFLHYTEDSHRNNAFHRMANFDADFQFPRDSSLRLTDIFARTSDPPSSEITDRVQRVQNDAGLSSQWGLIGRLGVLIEGLHTLHNYRDEPFSTQLDRQEFRGVGGLLYKVAPKTQVGVQYRYTQIEYDSTGATNDSQTHNAQLTVRGRLSPKIMGTIAAGPQWRTYHQSVANAPTEAKTGSLSMNLEWKPSVLTSVLLIGGRTFEESIFESNRYYVADAVSLGIDRALGIKWRMNLLGRFEADKYPEPTAQADETGPRKDKSMQFGGQIAYDIQPWIALGLRYLYRQRESNIPVDYRNHIAGVSLKVKL